MDYWKPFSRQISDKRCVNVHFNATVILSIANAICAGVAACFWFRSGCTAVGEDSEIIASIDDNPAEHIHAHILADLSHPLPTRAEKIALAGQNVYQFTAIKLRLEFDWLRLWTAKRGKAARGKGQDPEASRDPDSGTFHLEVNQLRASIAVVADAIARFQYSRSELMNYAFDVFGVRD